MKTTHSEARGRESGPPLIRRLILGSTMGAVMLLLLSCNARTVKREIVSPEQLRDVPLNTSYLKVHMRDGGVYVLKPWSVDSLAHSVTGEGVALSVTRDTTGRGRFQIPIDSALLFETNQVHMSAAVAVLSVVTAAAVVAGIYCLANPKACFGSCPTFYVSDENGDMLQAEGFSSSIAPSLIATDIDALSRADVSGSHLDIEMRNEALETHVVHGVHLLAAPRGAGLRVFATEYGTFWRTAHIQAPSTCTDQTGDVREAVLRFDGLERVSLADSFYLAAKEHVSVSFDSVPPGRYGLVVASRQSLLNTYLFYQLLAYMGTTVGDWYAWMERQSAPVSPELSPLGERLGWIDIEMRDEAGLWKTVGRAGETGPLATNLHVVPLQPNVSGSVSLQIEMTRGLWRLDYLALARLDDSVTPVRIAPETVMQKHNGRPGAAVCLVDSTRPLCTLPGDNYTFRFELPEVPSAYEFFLESRGYYIEWMREEWLAEENPALAVNLLTQPDQALRRLAPEFKNVENEMESTFWSSRYAR